MVQLLKNPPTMWETWVSSLGWEKSSGEGKGYPLQYSGLENSMEGVPQGVPKIQMRLSLSYSKTMQGKFKHKIFSCPLASSLPFTEHSVSAVNTDKTSLSAETSAQI